MKSIEKVKDFWEKNPLWQGESNYEVGSTAYFEEHNRVCLKDCFAGEMDKRILPEAPGSTNALDLGCGPGFWSEYLLQYGCKKVVSADLTEQALQLTRERCRRFPPQRFVTQLENAEQLSFTEDTFDHVNCQGVIHHTPGTQKAVAEIARVLKKGGTASVSVYYKNIFVRNWRLLRWFGVLINKLGFGLKGRGRESIYAVRDVEQLIRLYDGADNPIGKVYSKAEFTDMLEPYFKVNDLFLHFFPARSLPFKLPGALHRLLDRRCGFLLYASLEKR